MINAASLMKLNIHVFPCNADKSPRCKGDWRQYRGPVDAEVFGIPVPHGLIVLDLDYHKGLERSHVERILGCNPGDLRWDEAELQTTMHGGRHYVFRAPEGLRQGSDIHGIVGFDTRIAGKGYIASGTGYKQIGAGIARLAYPDTFPELPISAQRALRPVEHNTPPPHLRVAPAPVGASSERAREMLKFIPPSCNRDTWLKVGLAMRSALLPFELFDEWSRGDLHGGVVPENYSGSEYTMYQYRSFKPEGKTSISTLRFLATQNGWREDWSSVFAGGNERSLKTVIEEIIECGADPTGIKSIVKQIRDTPLDMLERQIALSTLKSELKNAGLLTKDLSRAINDATKAPLVHKDVQVEHSPAPKQLPERLSFDELLAAGHTIGRASSNHGQNAVYIASDILQARYKRDGDKFRWWDGTHWSMTAERDLEQLLCLALMPDHAMQSTITGTKWLLRKMCPPLPPAVNARAVYFSNGALDVERGNWYPHERLNYNTGCLTVEYDAEAACPLFMSFVNSIFGGLDDARERIDMLQEIIGYALIDDTLNLQKAIALDGASRGGKGLVMGVITALRGAKNFGIFSFSGLANPKQQNAFISQRIVMDMDAKSPPRREQDEVATFFNKVVSNEPVSIPVLYESTPYHGRTGTKMIIACNGIPQLADDSGATTNRWATLQFCRSFAGREDRSLYDRLTSPDELRGIAAWAVKGLKRLIDNNVEFTSSASSIESIESLRETNQPYMEFIKEYVRLGNSERCHIRELYEAYRIFAGEAGYWMPSRASFTQAMRQTTMPMGIAYKRNLKIGGKNKAGFIGCAPLNASPTTIAFSSKGDEE